MIIGGGCGAYMIIRWKVESDLAADDLVDVDFTIAESIEEELPTQTEDNPTPQPSASSGINFTQLKATNSSTLGWIKVNNTRINYPIVQSNDNEYYLKHSFNHSLNSSGAIFLDYRNPANLSGKHSIIYGHGRVEGTMFGTLQNALSSSWQNNSANHIINIFTESETLQYKVFSAYRLPNTNDYLRTLFRNHSDFMEFVTMLKSRSVYNFGTEVSENDQILTLSTCIGKNERMVLHAKRIN